jgi:hypothetical protein
MAVGLSDREEELLRRMGELIAPLADGQLKMQQTLSEQQRTCQLRIRRQFVTDLRSREAIATVHCAKASQELKMTKSRHKPRRREL